MLKIPTIIILFPSSYLRPTNPLLTSFKVLKVAAVSY